MKNLILLPLIYLFSLQSSFSQIQNKMEIYELAVNAKTIVTGKITEVKGGKFKLEVKKCLIGDAKGSISVSRFRNTKLSKRWGKYVVDTEVMLFLENEGDSYKILGANGEGEKLIIGEDIYLDSRGGAVKNQFVYKDLGEKARIYGEKINLAEFEVAVLGLRSILEVGYDEKERKNDELEWVAWSAYTADETKVNEVKNLSPTAAKLCSKAEKAFKE